jgi:hypothetical protein
LNVLGVTDAEADAEVTVGKTPEETGVEIDRVSDDDNDEDGDEAEEAEDNTEEFEFVNTPPPPLTTGTSLAGREGGIFFVGDAAGSGKAFFALTTFSFKWSSGATAMGVVVDCGGLRWVDSRVGSARIAANLSTSASKASKISSVRVRSESVKSPPPPPVAELISEQNTKLEIKI